MTKDERYENAKKYRCHLLPEECFAGCEVRVRGGEPDNIDCILCVATSLNANCRGLWSVLLSLGTQDGKTASVLNDIRAAYQNTALALSVVGPKLKSSYNAQDREGFTAMIEHQLQEMIGRGRS